MPKIKYEDWKPSPASLALVRRAIAICEDYAEQGYDLTLRQLYYRFVAADIIPNNQRSYKRLGSVIDRARMAGLLDWDFIVDRTRNPRSTSHWESPAEIIEGAAGQYRIDKWAGQPTYVEVWIEKDALIGVIEPVCRRNDVTHFSCRGYVSQSEQWRAARRLFRRSQDADRTDIVILHLGDHDPSGLDMTRDIRERIQHFLNMDFVAQLVERYNSAFGPIGQDHDVDHWEDWAHDQFEDAPRLTIKRLALNMDQVEEYDPPPNFAKMSDSRAEAYVAEHGPSSWELDALEPPVLDALIQDAIDDLRDPELWAARLDVENEHRTLLARASDRWEDLVEVIGDAGPDEVDSVHLCDICGEDHVPEPCCPGCGCGSGDEDED